MEQGYGVEGAGRFVLVLQVGEDIPVPRKGLQALRHRGEFRLSVAAVAAEAEAGVGAGCMNLGGGQIVAFGYAEGCVLLSEKAVGLFGEPGGMAELEGDPVLGESRDREKGSQAGTGFVVGFEVRGKLKEQETELAGMPDGLKRGDELGNQGLAIT